MNLLEKYTSSDFIFSINRNWNLNRYKCEVLFFTEEPLNDLYYVICSILKEESGHFDKKSLALLLGFNVIDDFESEQKIYFDIAEEHLFEDLLNRVQKEHLISIIDDEVFLTNLGTISLKEGKHYRFYKGSQYIYEHQSINSNMPMALQMFPFYEDMGIYTILKKSEQYFWPSDDYVESIIYHQTTPLIKRIDKQSKDKYNIYYAEIDDLFENDSHQVQINLYSKGGEYVPVVMKSENEAAEKATQLILNGLNDTFKDDLILDCLFQRFWNDPNSILNYTNLEPYINYLDFEKLAKDDRTIWNDKKLFTLIVECANQNCWRYITQNCDISVLCNNIEQIKDKIDWQIFTIRAEDQFLIDNFLSYPWDLEVISSDYKRNIHTIEKLICLNKQTEEEWDWVELQSRLTDEFIISHIEFVEVDLSKYTEDKPTIQNAILNNLEKSWDWFKIEESFSLDFIEQHIATLGNFFTFETLFDRIFTDPRWAKKFINSINFKNFLSKNISEDGKLSKIVLNDKNYIWSIDAVIHFLREYNLIYWASTPYVKGFECNPFIVWSKPTFIKYSSFISTEQGYEQVSKRIEDISILSENKDFPWEWDMVSSNLYLLDNPELYQLYGDKLNWEIVFTHDNYLNIFESIDNIENKIGDNENAWLNFSQIASLPYVKSHYKYNWNWQILTKRMFKSLKLEHLGHKDFVNKWDWDYITENVSLDFLKENLKKYCSFWNWSKVFGRIISDEESIEQTTIDELANILSAIPDNTVKKTAWTALTSCLSFNKLIELVPKTVHLPKYEWDIQYFSAHEKFNISVHLPKCYQFIDWETLSSSPAATKSFSYNNKSQRTIKAWKNDTIKILDNPYYKWNYKSLSMIPYLYNQHWFVAKYTNKIDWDIVSEYSELFTVPDKQKLNNIIDEFKNFINFDILSQRVDIDINQILKIYPNGNYNFNSLISNKILKPTIKLIKSKPFYEWDYFLLTSQPTFKPNADFLIEKMDEHMNWKSLSSLDYDYIWGKEELIKAVAFKETIRDEIDWHTISSRPYFPLNTDLLMIIPIDKLNWTQLSQRKDIVSMLNLDFVSSLVDWRRISSNPYLEVNDDNLLEKYKDSLDWYTISNRSDFDITEATIEKFYEYIDWSAASSSTKINFTVNLVEKFEDKWNWALLVQNKAFYNKIDIGTVQHASKHNILRFLNLFPIRPKAYHFTHISNAIKIIKSMKLQSRNFAEGNFDNSAGTNVTRTNKAHRFARFYFVPQSPTQFYNEFLGKDKEDKYYNKAMNLGLPKCPLPIFFVFDIEELLMKMPSLCYYSNGNMQKDSAKSFRIIEVPDRIRASEIYINSYETKDQRQQEFLVEGELDFSNLNNFQICCFDEVHKQLLLEALGDSKWNDKITIDRSLYIHKNKQLFFKETDKDIIIDTNYKDSFEFRVSYSSSMPSIINEEKITQQKGNNIFMKDKVNIQKTVPFNIYFEVNYPRTSSWLIYSFS